MAHELVEGAGGTPSLAMLDPEADEAPFAVDGVSCAVCHRIAPEGLGTAASFSGAFALGPEGELYGPHAAPFARPMEARTGLAPVAADHVTSSALCGSCHTLFTDAVAADGTPLGARFPEQTPYLEWRNSAFDDEQPDPGPRAASCQACHAPAVDEDGAAIATAIAPRPGGGDFPPVDARSPYGRHVFVGGNTVVPALLRELA
jgi:hypothetical protein